MITKKTDNELLKRYCWIEKSFLKKRLCCTLEETGYSASISGINFSTRREKVSLLGIIKESVVNVRVSGKDFNIPLYENITQQVGYLGNKEFIDDISQLKNRGFITESVKFSFYDLLESYDIYFIDIDDITIPYFVINSLPKKDNNIVAIPFTTEELIDLTLLKEFLEGKIYIDAPGFKKGYEPPTQHIYLDTLGVWVYFNYTVNLRYSIFSKGKNSRLFKSKNKLLQDGQYYGYLMGGWITTETMARRFGKTTRIIHDLLTELWSVQTNRYIRLFYAISSTDKLRKFIFDMLEITSDGRAGKIYNWGSTEGILEINRYDDKGKIIEGNPLSRLELISSQEKSAGRGDDPTYIYIDECEDMVEKKSKEFLGNIVSIVGTERIRMRKISTINDKGLVTNFVKGLWKGEEDEQERIENGMGIKEFLLSKYNYFFGDISYEDILAGDKEEIKKLKDKPRDIIRESLLERKYVGVRIPGKCNELLNEIQMEEAISVIMDHKGYLGYLTEWECRLPEEDEPLEINGSLISRGEVTNKFDWILQVVDPRDTGKDKPASVMFGFDQGKVIIFNEDELSGDIIQVSKETEHIFLNKYNDNIKMFSKSKDGIPANKILLFDSRGIGAGLKTHLSNKGIPSVRYMSTSTYKWTYKDGQCNVGKMYAYDYMKNMFAFSNILIINDCSKVIASLKHFKPFFNDETGYMSAKGELGHNDDFANCVMMGVWYISEKMGYRSQLTSGQNIYQIKKQKAEINKNPQHEWSQWGAQKRNITNTSTLYKQHGR